MNLLGFFLKDIKNIIILVLILFAGFFIFKSNRLDNKFNQVNLDYHNELAMADSLREVGDNQFQKLGLISTERDMEKIAKEELEEKLNGKIIEINKLNIKLINISNRINNITMDTKVDTIYVNNTMQYNFTYPYTDENKDYKFESTVKILAKARPTNVDLEYDLTFKPIDLIIFTHKNSDFSYSVTVKSSSDFIQFTDVNAYIPPPESEFNKSFYKKIDLALGAGIDNTGKGFILGGIKYSKNIFNIMYSGDNGNYGFQYQRFIFGN